MWKPEHRRAADRHGLRYPSDLSDSEWALIEPAIPPAKRGGRRREVNVREVLNALLCTLDGVPVAGVAEGSAAEKHRAFLLHAVGLGRHAGAHPSRTLYVETREREGREASPPAAIIDSQSARAAQKGAPRSTRRGLMRARRSSGANATSWSIRSASC